MRIVVTGANRGIGLEFVRQFAARGDDVVATARHPASATRLQSVANGSAGRVSVYPLDVLDDRSARALAEALGDLRVDVLINNAGISGKMTSLEDLDLPDVLRTFDVDALGPIRVTRALLPSMRRAGTRKIVHITSKMGSISDNTSGGAYGYRMAKAALNMACKSMALDLGEEGFTVFVVNPGWVQTAMGGKRAPTSVEESVANMIGLIDRVGPEASGKFFNHTGEEVPW